MLVYESPKRTVVVITESVGEWADDSDTVVVAVAENETLALDWIRNKKAAQRKKHQHIGEYHCETFKVCG